MWWQIRSITVCTQVVNLIQKQNTRSTFLCCTEDLLNSFFGFTLIFAQNIAGFNTHIFVSVFHQFMDKSFDQVSFTTSRRSIEKKTSHCIHSKQLKESFFVCIFDMFLKFFLHVLHSGNIIKRLLRSFTEPAFFCFIIHGIFITGRFACCRNVFIFLIFKMIQNSLGSVQMFRSFSLPSAEFIGVFPVSQKCTDLAAHF